MRRLWLSAVLAVVAAACTGGGQEPVTTPAPSSTATTTVPSSSEDPTTTTPSTTTSSTAGATTTTLPPLRALAYRPVWELEFPTVLTARAGEELIWLATKDGRLWTATEDGEPQPAGDLSGSVRNQGEQGLLGLALHPTDPARLFVHYSATDGDTVLSELAVTGREVDTGSERVLLRLDQPASNHNGGQLLFGPEGYLYLGLGDGGGAGDRFGNGQDPDTLLGTILRLDVDSGDPYAIPPGNPFVDGGGADEVWAFGLRNPWRFWIDQGTMYIGDVGQNAFEEIDAVALEPVGYNFGWPITEALHCFSPASGCDTTGLTLPVVEVAHGDGGTCSITGGVVVRDPALPELDGHYLYSDFCGGWLRSFRLEGGEAVDARDWTDQVGTAGQVVSFGVDGAGRVYVLHTSGVLQLVADRG